MKNQLKKAINITRKTGDRLIVFDTINSEEPFVVMPLSEYEKIAIGRSEVRDLTEDELLDKINRDIAIWKSEQKDEQKDIRNEMDNDIYFSNFREKEQEKNYYDYKEELDKKKAWGVSNHWNIPKSRKEAAEEIIEEDRQYLEKI